MSFSRSYDRLLNKTLIIIILIIIKKRCCNPSVQSTGSVNTGNPIDELIVEYEILKYNESLKNPTSPYEKLVYKFSSSFSNSMIL